MPEDLFLQNARAVGNSFLDGATIAVPEIVTDTFSCSVPEIVPDTFSTFADTFSTYSQNSPSNPSTKIMSLK